MKARCSSKGASTGREKQLKARIENEKDQGRFLVRLRRVQCVSVCRRDVRFIDKRDSDARGEKPKMIITHERAYRSRVQRVAMTQIHLSVGRLMSRLDLQSQSCHPETSVRV